MKKASVVLVLILGIVLISGFSCSEDSSIITACVPSICYLCGTYVSQADSSHYIEIHSDGTAFLREGGTPTSGTWYSSNTFVLMINWQGHPYATRWEIGTREITDDNGVVWKQQ